MDSLYCVDEPAGSALNQISGLEPKAIRLKHLRSPAFSDTLKTIQPALFLLTM